MRPTVNRRARNRDGTSVPSALPASDALESASAAGLRHVVDGSPGISRRRAGRGFQYRSPDGRSLTDRDTLARIRSLAIPPAWSAVWICPDPSGHLQATGRDARGRKQYRYHPRWRVVRDESKFGRMIAFARALPALRKRVRRDLTLRGLPRQKVLATVVGLLENTLIRVGNEEYARHNDSFGLTTLRNRHVDVTGSSLQLRFRGKGGKEHVIGVADRRLSRIVKQCRELPGYELFQYVDEQGERRSVESADVNAYIREVTGLDFTAKDFRTWAGTVLAAWALGALAGVTSKRQATRNVVRAVEKVAERLGNTPAVCRKSYVHPVVLETYLEGSLSAGLRSRSPRGVEGAAGLPPGEAMVLRLLARRPARPLDGGRPSRPRV